MPSITTDALQRMELNGEYTAATLYGTVDSTGVVSGALSTGLWEARCDIDCYWLRGDSTLAVGDVKVDESTPVLSKKHNGGDVIKFVVHDTDWDRIAFKTVSGGGSAPFVLQKRSGLAE